MKPSLVIVGLGNPGTSYAKTRHNTGFMAVDILEKHFGTSPWKDRPRFRAHVAEGRIVTSPVLLVKPQTYMNVSGETVRRLINFYSLRPTDQMLIITDDVDLPCGSVRFCEKGSGGTHNGLKSVVEQIGKLFPRIRIGMGQKSRNADLALWVLSVPPPSERKKIEEACQKLPEIITTWLLGDAPTASPQTTPPKH